MRGKRVHFTKVFNPLGTRNIGETNMSGQVSSTNTAQNPVREGEAHGAETSPELKLRELVELKQNELGEYYLEPNTKLLKVLEGRGIDNSFDKRKQEFGVLDGFAGLYVTLVNRRDDVVLVEYHDELVSMYKLARWSEVKDMVIVRCEEEGSCGVATPEKENWIVTE